MPRLAFVLALALAASGASAQLPSLDLERLSLDPAARGSLVVGNGEVLPLYGVRLSAGAHWERDPLVVTDLGVLVGRGVGSDEPRAASAVKDRLTLHLGLAATVLELDQGPKIEVSVRAPMVAWQQSEDLGATGLRDPSDAGFARPWVGLKVAGLSQDAGAPVSAAVSCDFLVPPGKRSALAGEDAMTFVPRLEVGRRFEGWLIAAQAGGILRTEKIELPGLALRNELTAGLAVATHGRPLRAELSARGSSTLGSTHATRQSFETLAGLRYAVGRAELFALGGPGFFEAPGSPTWRGLLGFAWEWARPMGFRPPAARIAAPTPAPAPAPAAVPAPAVERPAPPIVAPAPPEPPVKVPASTEAAPPRATLTEKKIELHEVVYFETGKATIQDRSFSLLDEVAALLVENPRVARVLIEGHTDGTGPATVNRTLSQQRAEAVRAYLVKKGVDVSRLDAKGFGPDRPVADDATAEGRDRNRRVELVVTDTSM